MSRQKNFLTSTLLSLAGFSIIAVPTAFAADPGTYRPGMAYDSITAASADLCDAQCSGDAQCRGWNFVKVNPQAPIGVCEFNAQAAAPVPSRYSVSGENNSAIRSATIIPGRSNTVRVGNMSPATVTPPKITQPTPTRRVVREAVPQKTAAQTVAHRRPAPRGVTPEAMQNLSLTEQQNLQRQQGQRPDTQMQRPQMQRPQGQTQGSQFRHDLGNGQPITAPQQAPRQVMRPSPAPRYNGPQNIPNQMSGDPRLQQRLMQQRQIQQRQMPQSQMQPQARPQGQLQQQPAIDPRLSATGQAVPPGVPSYRPQAMPQQQAQHQQVQRQPVQRQPMQRPSVNIPSEMAPQRPMTAAQAQQSLFGSLHDDVKIPRPIDPVAVARNPDAPIPTVSNVPVAPVQMQPMRQPVREAPDTTGLAGAATR
ncbi:hypothetical protein [Fretibacter rubidus]|uniref:hypothetical protein n=1 Tax=Fretibacter rubidus TaxID=570162 RepID=UPI00352AAD93